MIPSNELINKMLAGVQFDKSQLEGIENIDIFFEALQNEEKEFHASIPPSEIDRKIYAAIFIQKSFCYSSYTGEEEKAPIISLIMIASGGLLTIVSHFIKKLDQYCQQRNTSIPACITPKIARNTFSIASMFGQEIFACLHEAFGKPKVDFEDVFRASWIEAAESHNVNRMFALGARIRLSFQQSSPLKRALTDFLSQRWVLALDFEREDELLALASRCGFKFDKIDLSIVMRKGASHSFVKFLLSHGVNTCPAIHYCQDRMVQRRVELFMETSDIMFELASTVPSSARSVEYNSLLALLDSLIDGEPTPYAILQRHCEATDENSPCKLGLIKMRSVFESSRDSRIKEYLSAESRRMQTLSALESEWHQVTASIKSVTLRVRQLEEKLSQTQMQLIDLPDKALSLQMNDYREQIQGLTNDMVGLERRNSDLRAQITVKRMKSAMYTPVELTSILNEQIQIAAARCKLKMQAQVRTAPKHSPASSTDDEVLLDVPASPSKIGLPAMACCVPSKLSPNLRLD